MPPHRKKTSGNVAGPARRGRPKKFGRPAQVVALTLPEDVLHALRTLHRDPGWAIVHLVERLLGESTQRRQPEEPAPLAELVHLPGRHALIVVEPKVFRQLRGVSTIPLSDGRAFLAFDQAAGLADLEVAILDRLEAVPAKSAERTQLTQAGALIRSWRRGTGLAFRTKSIIVVEGLVGVERRPLATLAVPAQADANARREPRRRSERNRQNVRGPR